jgi:hypothetical protein
VTPEFLSAVADTLFPGDDAAPPLPSATTAGVAARLRDHLATGRDRAACGEVLEAIARAAGGDDAFVRSDADVRVDTLKRVEAELAGPFRTLVSLALRDYYEAEAVLLAMGWRAAPPQPEGHDMPPFDDTLLEQVKRRGRMWR